jgi:hypothetical protein
MCNHSNHKNNSQWVVAKRAMIWLLGIASSIFAIIKMNGVEVNLALYGAVAAALLAGHYAGDYILQTDHMAKWKVAKDFFVPEKFEDGTPKEQYNLVKSIRANVWHVVTYHWAMIMMVGLTGLIQYGSPIKWIVALVISMIAHGVIDRRWPVKFLMTRTGSKSFFESGAGAPHVDQTLHIVTIVLLAAWIAM